MRRRQRDREGHRGRRRLGAGRVRYRAVGQDGRRRAREAPVETRRPLRARRRGDRAPGDDSTRASRSSSRRRSRCRSSRACFRYYAGWADKLYGETHPVDPRLPQLHAARAGRRRRHDHPVELPAAARRRGSSRPRSRPGCVACSSRRSSRRSRRCKLGALCSRPGFPPGVVNVVTGRGSIAGPGPRSSTRGVDKIAFTGSTEVGRTVMRSAAGTIKRVSLELGGKSPEHRLRRREAGRGGATARAAASSTTRARCARRDRGCSSRRRSTTSSSSSSKPRWRATRPATRSTTRRAWDRRCRRRTATRSCSASRRARKEGAKVVAGGARATHVGGRGFFCEPTVLTGRHATT